LVTGQLTHTDMPSEEMRGLDR